MKSNGKGHLCSGFPCTTNTAVRIENLRCGAASTIVCDYVIYTPDPLRCKARSTITVRNDVTIECTILTGIENCSIIDVF